MTLTPDMLPRQPFQMRGNRRAQARYTFIDSKGVERKVLKSGRASYVWLHAVLIPLACGVTESVEIRMDAPKTGPWHTITGADDAYAQLLAYYPMMRATKRMVARRRAQKGMTT